METVEALAARVKSLQSSSPAVRQRWTGYCDLYNSGKLDPTKASVELLKSFIELEQSGGADFQSISEFEKLLVQVKAGQRNDPAFKEAWGEYCNNSQGGFRDPAKHTEESLRSFLESTKHLTGGASLLPGTGTLPAAGGGGGGKKPGKSMGMGGMGGGMGGMDSMTAMAQQMTMMQMSQMFPEMAPQLAGMMGKGMGAGGPSGSQDNAGITAVKFGQKHSEHFKNLWGLYVQQHGNGKRDPGQYDEQFLGGFLNFMAARCMGVDEQPAEGSAVKRPRYDHPGAAGYQWGSSW
jgi:hypothetical protein